MAGPYDFDYTPYGQLGDDPVAKPIPRAPAPPVAPAAPAIPTVNRVPAVTPTRSFDNVDAQVLNMRPEGLPGSAPRAAPKLADQGNYRNPFGQATAATLNEFNKTTPGNYHSFENQRLRTLREADPVDSSATGLRKILSMLPQSTDLFSQRMALRDARVGAGSVRQERDRVNALQSQYQAENALRAKALGQFYGTATGRLDDLGSQISAENIANQNQRGDVLNRGLQLGGYARSDDIRDATERVGLADLREAMRRNAERADAQAYLQNIAAGGQELASFIQRGGLEAGFPIPQAGGQLGAANKEAADALYNKQLSDAEAIGIDPREMDRFVEKGDPTTYRDARGLRDIQEQLAAEKAAKPVYSSKPVRFAEDAFEQAQTVNPLTGFLYDAIPYMAALNPFGGQFAPVAAQIFDQKLPGLGEVRVPTRDGGFTYIPANLVRGFLENPAARPLEGPTPLPGTPEIPIRY